MKEAIEIHKRRIPRKLLLLDAVGAVLVAIGVLELLDIGPQLIPAAARAPWAGIAFLCLGTLLMLAVPVWLLRRHRDPGDRSRGSAQS
jgi:hypothetical protein